MTKSFEINGKTYKAKDFTYNTICELQDMGIDIEKMGDRNASMVRAFFAIWSGMSAEDAGNEIGEHMMSGGSLDELGEAINDCMENSDFFRYLTTAQKTAEKKD